MSDAKEKMLPLNDQFMEQLTNTAFIVTYKGRAKVEAMSFVAHSREEAVELSQKFCSERKLKWLNVSRMFVDIKEKVQHEKED